MLVTLCITETTSWGILYYAFPVLAIIFVVAAVIVLSQANPSAPAGDGPPPLGGFLITDRMLGMFKGKKPDPVKELEP